jgi:hypothetical protein
MKVIERSIEVLPQSATRIASSMETAANTVAEQGKAFADDVAGCAMSLKSDAEAIAVQVAAIPSMIDPAPIVASCKEALDAAANDLRRLGSDAGEIPKRLLEQAATVQQVIDEAVRTAKALPGAIPALAELVPDLQTPLAFFNGLPARGDALANQARQTIGMFEQYGRQLIPLSRQLSQLGAPGLADGSIAQSLTARAKSLQSDTLAEIQTLRSALQANVADLSSGVDGVGASALQMVDGAAVLLRKTGADLMAPLQAQIEFVERMQAALRSEAEACDSLFVDFSAQLDRAGDIVFKPMEEARMRVDRVIEQLQAAAANVDAMLKKALQPIDALEVRADIIKQALDDVLNVVGEEAVQIQGLLAELDAEAEKAKAALLGLPENFTPVRDKIAEAVALLEDIKGRIPVFVGQANRALDSAAAELDQAEGLCNNAIEVCTRYMMKAPPLMAARTLFLGVKSMIPGVKATIATARKTVQAAGNQASGLMDQGIATVEALYPLLDQAIARFKAAIDALVALLVKLQAAVQQVSDIIGAIPPELSAQLDTATAAMHQVLDKIQATVEECLAKMGCEALAQRLQQELSALLDRTAATMDQKINEACAPLQKALQQGREGVGKAADVAQESLGKLHSALLTAQVQAQKPIQQLEALLMSSRSHIASLNSSAKQQISQAEAKVLAIADQIAQKVSGLTIEVPNLPSQLQAAASGYAAFAANISADPQALVRQAGSLQNWRRAAQQNNDVIAADIDKASAEATQGLDEVRAASGDLRSEAQNAGENAIDAEAMTSEIDDAMSRMKQDAQAAADNAEAARGDMDASMAETSAEAEGVTDHYGAVSDRLLQGAQAEFDRASEAANEAKKAEPGLAAEIVAAEESVGKASQEAAAETEALKNEAQAGIDAALAEVQSVQAQVESARSDAIKAEAIVDAEVVKHGGESTLARQEEVKDGGQSGKTNAEASNAAKDGAAAEAKGSAASSAAGNPGESAEQAGGNTKSAAADGEAAPPSTSDGSDTAQPETADVAAGNDADRNDIAEEVDGNTEDMQANNATAPANASQADADDSQKRSTESKQVDASANGKTADSAKRDLDARTEEPEPDASLADEIERDAEKQIGKPADDTAIADTAALDLAEGPGGSNVAAGQPRQGMKDIPAAPDSAPPQEAFEASGKPKADPGLDLKKARTPKNGTQDAAGAGTMPASSVSPKDAEQLDPSKLADASVKKGQGLKGLNREAAPTETDKIELPVKDGTVPDGPSVKEGIGDASLAGKPKLPADAALPGTDALGSAPAVPDDTEAAFKEALRARVSDAAGKELA